MPYQLIFIVCQAAGCSITSRGKMWSSHTVGIEDGAFYKTLGSWKATFNVLSLNVNALKFLLIVNLKSGVVFIVILWMQVVAGGVASNQYVRSRLDMIVKKNGLQLVCPPPSLCTDNGNKLFLVLAINKYVNIQFGLCQYSSHFTLNHYNASKMSP